MAALGKTGIPYADYGWPLVTGCSNAGPACDHCYAARYAATRGKHLPQYAGLARKVATDLTSQGHIASRYQWTGDVRFHPELLDAPLHTKKPGRVFTVPTGDLFHEGVTWDQIDAVLAVMAATPHLRYVIVTKRPERMHVCFTDRERPQTLVDPLPNVWLVPTVWDQESADRVIPILLDTPAAVRWVSIEPMLGAVDLRQWLYEEAYDPEYGPLGPTGPGHWLDLVVLGGETGPGARPMRPEWALSVYRQCKAAGVPFWFKQWGREHPFHIPGPELYTQAEYVEMLDMEATHELPAALAEAVRL